MRYNKTAQLARRATRLHDDIPAHRNRCERTPVRPGKFVRDNERNNFGWQSRFGLTKKCTMINPMAKQRQRLTLQTFEPN